jgi:transposase
MPRTARKHFSREFKMAALSRVQDGVRSMSDVARELGVHPATLRQWKRQLGGLPRLGPGGLPGGNGAERAGPHEPGLEAMPPESLEAEVLRLRREVAKLRQERDILKKAAAFFARDVP